MAMPVYTIELKDLRVPAEVSHFGKKHRIKECVYEFYNIHTNEVLKYGVYMGTSKMWLERIYRQAGNTKGWQGGVLKGSAGADMYKHCAENWPDLHKDDVGIRIHDMCGKSKEECLTKEDELVKGHKKLHGFAPAGNVRPTQSYGPSEEQEESFDKLFDEVV